MLSEENRALVERIPHDYAADDYGQHIWSEAELNALLDAARSEGPSPASRGEDSSSSQGAEHFLASLGRSDAPSPAGWRDNHILRAWVRNGFLANSCELRERGRRAKARFSRDSETATLYREPNAWYARVCDEAAAVFELRAVELPPAESGGPDRPERSEGSDTRPGITKSRSQTHQGLEPKPGDEP